MSDEEVNPDVFTALGVMNVGCQRIHDVRNIQMWMLPEIIQEAIYMDCLLDTINYIGTIRPGLVAELYKEVFKLTIQPESKSLSLTR